jgi:hypothetical protein
MKYIYAFYALVLLSSNVAGQISNLNLVSSSGGKGQNGDISLCWSLGEAVTGLIDNNNFIIQEGYHQGSLEIISGVENLPVDLEITAFPNPVKEVLSIKFSSEKILDPWTIEVFNSEGKIMFIKDDVSDDSEIDFSTFSRAHYLIRIANKQGYFKVFNIIKQ